MKDGPKLPCMIRYPLAAALSFFAAWELLPLADEIGFLKSTVGGPFQHIAENAVEQIIFTVVLVFPALCLIDWLIKSRTQTIFISLASLIVLLWFASSGL